MEIEGLSGTGALDDVASDVAGSFNFDDFRSTLENATTLQLGIASENAKANSLIALAQKISDVFQKLR